MSKHTPGPWVYKKTSGFDYGSTAYWVPGICTNIDKEADARLIAAAPDLLEALKRMEFAFSPLAKDCTLAGLIDEARAAIAKATGGEA